MKYLRVILICVIPISVWTLCIPLEENELEHKNTADVVAHMTNQYISPKTNTLLIMRNTYSGSSIAVNFNLRMLQRFFKKLNGRMKYKIFTTADTDEPLDYTLFWVSSSGMFRELQSHVTTSIAERDMHFFIVLNTYKIPDPDVQNVNMVEIFKICLQHRVTYAVIMIKVGPDDFDFYSYKYANKHICEYKIHLERVNTWRNGTLQYDLLFPSLENGANGCTLNVGVRFVAPLLSYKDRFNSEVAIGTKVELKDLTGFEGKLLQHLAKAMAFKMNFIAMPLRASIGLHSNSTGAFALLENQTVDMIIGAYEHTEKNYQAFTPSVIYYHTSMVLALRSDYKFGTIGQLANPFDTFVWLTIALTLLGAVLVIKSIALFCNRRVRAFVMGRSNDSPICNVIAVMLGNPIPRLPGRNFARFLFMLWMMLALLLRSAYQGKLFDSLRLARRAHVPRTVTEAAQLGYKLISSTPVDYYPPALTLIQNVTDRYEILLTSPPHTMTVVFLERLFLLRKIDRRFESLTRVREPLYRTQLVIFFRKHSIIRYPVNYYLKFFVEAGIVEHIANRHLSSRYLSKASKWLYRNRRQKISNRLLVGVYSMCGILLLVAMLAFWLERRSLRSPRVQRALNWLHY